jgi:hypothetical protein
MVMYYKGSRPVRTIGSKQNIFEYKKAGERIRAQQQQSGMHRSGISMADQRKLEETAAMADAFLKQRYK